MSEYSAIVQLQNLSTGYIKPTGNLVLFENVNLSLHKGELVCFMGPNGIGKTTLIKTLTGLQKPLAGQIIKDDNNPFALVLTDKLTSTHMRVYDLVSYGRYPYLGWTISLQEEDHTHINNALNLIGIKNLADKKLYELSDGQLQMAMLAKALSQDTPILFLDEPTAHLDLNNRVEIMNLLRDLTRKMNKTILLATHELDLALQIADRIWLATNTKSIKEGTPEDLVLDGSFDEVFQFKGFDLKTGKMAHHAYRNFSIKLIGQGYEYLWTKNSLERCGFAIIEESSIEVIIKTSFNNTITWELNNKTSNSIHELLEYLDTLSNSVK